MSVHLFIVIGVAVALLAVVAGAVALLVYFAGVRPRRRAAAAEARADAAERETDGLV